jgi:AcrR family transcriptional regulator
MDVYNHFDSRDGIIEALYIQGFERLSEALTTIGEIQDPYEALREAGASLPRPRQGAPVGAPADVPAHPPGLRAQR